jgi:hypothetical protein
MKLAGDNGQDASTGTVQGAASRSESIKPSKERYGLVIYVVLAATAAITPWIRGGVAVYTHPILWEAMLVATYFARWRSASGAGARRQRRSVLWIGLLLVIFAIPH